MLILLVGKQTGKVEHFPNVTGLHVAGIERVAPALEGRVLTTGPPGKSLRANVWLCGSASISNF